MHIFLLFVHYSLHHITYICCYTLTSPTLALVQEKIQSNEYGVFISAFSVKIWVHLSCDSVVSDSATLWTAGHQDSLSIANSWSLLKLMSIVSVMPSNHLILCRPLLLPPSIFPSIKVFQMSQFSASDGQSIGVSASASVLPIFRTDFL